MKRVVQNPSEAFCGVETWVVPMPFTGNSDTKALHLTGRTTICCVPLNSNRCVSIDQFRQLNDAVERLFARDGESALRDRLPGERAYTIRK